MAGMSSMSRRYAMVIGLCSAFWLGTLWRYKHHSSSSLDGIHSRRVARLAGNSAISALVEGSAPDMDRNLAYWGSAVATAREIRAMVKQDLEREYGLDQQTEMLTRLVKAVREMQGRRQHEWASRLRTTASPTPRKKPVCVNNPPMHFERTGDMIKECSTFKRTTEAEVEGWQPERAVILTLKSASAPEVSARVAFLGKQGIAATAFPATDGASKFAKEYTTATNTDTGRPELVFTDSRTPGAPALRRGDVGFLMPGERGCAASARTFPQVLSFSALRCLSGSRNARCLLAGLATLRRRRRAPRNCVWVCAAPCKPLGVPIVQDPCAVGSN